MRKSVALLFAALSLAASASSSSAVGQTPKIERVRYAEVSMAKLLNDGFRIVNTNIMNDDPTSYVFTLNKQDVWVLCWLTPKTNITPRYEHCEPLNDPARP